MAFLGWLSWDGFRGGRPVGGTSAGPAKVSSFVGGTSSLLERSPIPASPTRLKEARRATLGAASEGSPVLRETALPASGAMDGGAQAASRERRPWKADANVRRRGTGDPEATLEPELRVASLRAVRRRGRQKFRRFSEDLVTPRAFADPRLACLLTMRRTPKPRVSQESGRPRGPSSAGPLASLADRGEVAELFAGVDLARTADFLRR